MTLKDEGFRYVLRDDGSFRWIHPLEVQATDTDCTDMSDDEFEVVVLASKELA